MRCRADTIHDEIIDLLNSAAANGASLVEISGALHAALIQVQGQVWESLQLQRVKEIGGRPMEGKSK